MGNSGVFLYTRHMQAHTTSAPAYTVILFYKFFPVENAEAFRDEMRALAEQFGLKGRILIASEGINATLEGPTESTTGYIEAMHANPLFADLVIKESEGTGNAFGKLVTRVRDEVVTLGAGEFDIEKETAPSITAEELERMYDTDKDFVVLDLRNDYETAVGVFERTIDPGLKNFRDLPEKLPEIAHLKDKKVVAVCTGGIRCEKATCLLKKEGFTDIVQLKDGIHTYMQKFPGSHFKGSLFVFDDRMSTSVVDVPNREIVGKCAFCGAPSEDFYSDDSVRPSLKLICCSSCIESRRNSLRSCTA
jgi:UPF0176 protein